MIPSSPTYSKKSVQKWSHLYPVSIFSPMYHLQQLQLFPILEKKMTPYPIFSSSFSSIFLLPFYFLKESSIRYISTFPILSRTLSDHFIFGEQPWSRPSTITLLPQPVAMLVHVSHNLHSNTRQRITPSFHYLAFRTLFSGSPFTVYSFEPPLQAVY